MKLDGTIVYLNIMQIALGSVYAVIAPLLPFQVEERGLPQSITGMCFAIFSIAVIFFPSIIARLIERYGRKNTLLLGIMLMGVSFIFFGLADFALNPPLFTTLILVIRFLQGISYALFYTTSNSIITNIYSNDKEEVLGQVQISQGLGCMLGPLIGSLLFTFFGFKFVYFSFGITFFIYALITKFVLGNVENAQVSAHLPNEHNIDLLMDKVESQENLQRSGSEGEANFYSAFKLMRIPRFNFGICQGALSFILWSDLEPVYALRIEEFNLTSMQIGWFFCIIPLSFVLGGFFIPKLVLVAEKRLVLITCIFILSFAHILLGPSQVFQFPDSLLLIGVGSTILGFFMVVFPALALPEALEVVELKFPDAKISLKESTIALYTSFVGIGTLVGPLYGALMTQAVGFRLTQDFMAFFLLGYGSLYFITCDGKGAIRELIEKNFEHGNEDQSVEDLQFMAKKNRDDY